MKVQSYLSKVVSLTSLVGIIAVASLPAVAETSKKVGAETKPVATPAVKKPTVSETAPAIPTKVQPAVTETVPASITNKVKPAVSETGAPAKPTTEKPATAETTPSEKPTSTEKPASPATTESPAAPAQPSESTEKPTEKPTTADSATTVVGMVSSSNSFKTLAAAIKAADLDSTLAGKGPYTLFAPTDGAFAALPKGTVEALMKPENKDKLVKVLTYHVVPSEATTSSLKPGKVTSVEGSAIDVKVSGKEVMINDAKVLKADVRASNGIIHVIDKVILPPDAAK
ncbi:fasciclin domain-containing protein [Pseudanabaena sp. PCC 6802]|uniref:fasciclin domain-containing protein n=1 Tax=Pseudanabaena sp. PCC 6802 TaxID=118173 RepID=UPI0004769FFF|nr:fasciclin domain-containing protein [Pseudanabaena sp. PCC 6802]